MKELEVLSAKGKEIISQHNNYDLSFEDVAKLVHAVESTESAPVELVHMIYEIGVCQGYKLGKESSK